jgi:hypothetical protein
MTKPRHPGGGRSPSEALEPPDERAAIEAELDTTRHELAAAAAELETVRREWSSQRDRFEEQLALARRLASDRERELGRVRRDLHRLRQRPVIRAGSRVARATGRLVEATRSGAAWAVDAARGAAETKGMGDTGPAATHGLRASAAAERTLAEAVIARLPPVPAPATQTQPITVIIDWRGDRDRLRRTLEGLNRTAWPDLSVHVVDPTPSGEGAEDDEPAVAGAPAVHVRDPDRVAVYREILAGAATGYLLFLDDQVEPFEPAWLARLVDGLEATGAGAAGPRLILGRRPGPRRGPRSEAADLTLSRRGTSIVLEDGLPAAVGIGIGEDPLSEAAEATTVLSALPRACLLVRRDALAAAGGFRRDDLTDAPIDLFVRLREAGRDAVYVGGSVVWDRANRPRSSRHQAYGPGRAGEDPRACPRVFRATLLDGVSGAYALTDRPFAIGLVVAEAGAVPDDERALAGRLSGAFDRLGWQASTVAVADGRSRSWDPPVPVAIVMSPGLGRGDLPRDVVSMAFVRDRPEDWLADRRFDDHEIVIAASEEIRLRLDGCSAKRVIVIPAPASTATDVDALAESMRDALAQWAVAPKVAIHIPPRDWSIGSKWGDTQFARALQAEFERRDWPAAVLVQDERDSAPAIRADVALHVLGVNVPPVRSGQISLLWIISHPDRVTARLCEQYDRVFVASRLFSRHLADRIQTPVQSLLQATDPGRFFPDPSGPSHELLFVGNSRRSRRPILDALAGTKRDLAVYGTGWTPELLDPRHLKGEWIPNDQLRGYYSNAAIVLNDHWRDMRDDGFISNRVFDALASGGFVVSDRVPGIDEEFDDAVVTYERAEELEAIIDHYLAHPEERRERAERGRAAVLERHRFAHRVDAIIAAVGDEVDRRIRDRPRSAGSELAAMPAGLPAAEPATLL